MNDLLPPRIDTDTDADNSRQTVASAIALLSEGLIEPHELKALANIDSADIPTLLSSANMLAEVRRATLQLRISGDGARLDAARHARAAVQVAADLMLDAELHASVRLAAAESIHKTAGTHKPKTDSIPQERFRVIIHLGGGGPPIVIGSSTAAETHGEENAPHT
jgi:hypothetical protein